MTDWRRNCGDCVKVSQQCVELACYSSWHGFADCPVMWYAAPHGLANRKQTQALEGQCGLVTPGALGKRKAHVSITKVVLTCRQLHIRGGGRRMEYDRIAETIRLLAGPGRPPIIEQPAGRVCACCGQWTARADMMASTNHTHGLGSYCRWCNVAVQRDWAQRNPDKARAGSLLYYRRKVQNGGRLSGADKAALFEEADHRCLVCGTSEELQLDHVVPVSAGGSNDRGNRQVLCRRHNAEKGNRTINYRGP